MKIGILTVSDRASAGIYENKSGPAIVDYLKRVITTQWEPLPRVVPDGRASVREALIDLIDIAGCELVLVSGGTGPSPRDETPEGFGDVTEKELPGFGELMRRVSLDTVPTAILSRQSAGVRGKALMILLPGKPAAIELCLDAVFPAVPYCLDLIGAGRIETDSAVVAAFRPISQVER